MEINHYGVEFRESIWNLGALTYILQYKPQMQVNRWLSHKLTHCNEDTNLHFHELTYNSIFMRGLRHLFFFALVVVYNDI